MKSRTHLVGFAVMLVAMGLGLASSDAKAGPPNIAAMTHRYANAIAHVERTTPTRGGRHRRTAFFVSGRGHLVTASRTLALDDAVTVELRQGDRLRATVVATSSDGLVVLKLLPAHLEVSAARWTFLRLAAEESASVRSSGADRVQRPRGWFVALGHATAGHVVATAGEFAGGTVHQWLADIPATVGAPIISRSGRVVGVVDRRENAAQTRVRPTSLIRRLIEALVRDADATLGTGR